MYTAPAATILNVDDNAAKRYALTRRLQAAGFRVLEAATRAARQAAEGSHDRVTG